MRQSSESRLRLPVGDRDHRQGPANAAVTLVEYGDYQCPYCAEAYPIVKQIQQALGDQLQFVFRNFPLTTVHPDAAQAAEAAESAGAQGKFWEMHDLLFSHQHDLEDEDLERYAVQLELDLDRFRADLASPDVQRRIDADRQKGHRVGVQGTPTIFINGRLFHENPQSLIAYLREELDQ